MTYRSLVLYLPFSRTSALAGRFGYTFFQGKKHRGLRTSKTGRDSCRLCGNRDRAHPLSHICNIPSDVGTVKQIARVSWSLEPPEDPVPWGPGALQIGLCPGASSRHYEIPVYGIPIMSNHALSSAEASAGFSLVRTFSSLEVLSSALFL
jgi:hypothetical protein